MREDVRLMSKIAHLLEPQRQNPCTAFQKAFARSSQTFESPITLASTRMQTQNQLPVSPSTMCRHRIAEPQQFLVSQSPLASDVTTLTATAFSNSCLFLYADYLAALQHFRFK